MTVEEAVARIAQMPSDSVLVANPPFTWGAEAMFVELTDDFQVPEVIKNAGYQYLLEHSGIEELLEFLKKKKISSSATAAFVIHYAVNDCTPSWIDDIPDN